jgi:hypothetical protein
VDGRQGRGSVDPTTSRSTWPTATTSPTGDHRGHGNTAGNGFGRHGATR